MPVTTTGTHAREILVGRTISHYEVAEKIGEGGMGIVYKARDTHLDRVAALKVLPPERVADPERVRRFVQEARAASSLNHPNIVTIYDVDSADGQSFIAMEFVPGDTLDRLIGRRGMPLKQAVDCAIQIADALGRAHAAGIVHRDIKPSNIMVTPDGIAKILDFGLAKLVERAEDSGELRTRSMTQSPLTGEGQIVGTIAYMSPEQAAGEKLDARSDIFSFGAVLYEMVTGRRPFESGTPASTMKAILSSEPVAPAELTGSLPFELERAILRCLRKDPERRWQNMSDLKVALLDLKDDLDSGHISHVSTVAIRPRRRARRVVAGASIALLAVAAVPVVWWALRPTGAGTPTFPMERLTFEGDVTYPPSISDDGNLMAFSAEVDGRYNLFLQQRGARQPIRLTSHEANDWFPVFSPDGLKIVYRSERDGGGLYMVDTLGGARGAELKVADAGAYPSFSPDGSTIAFLVPDVFARTARMFLVAAAGGTPRPFCPGFTMRSDGSAYFQVPLWSPDGANILFDGRPVEKRMPATWRIARASGGDPVEVKDQPPWPEWRARFALAWRGEHLYYNEGEPTNGSVIYRVRIVANPWRIVGPPEKVASSADLLFGGSTSRGGQMLVTSLSSSVSIWSAPLTKAPPPVAALQRVTSDSFWKRRLSTTADGARLAFTTYSHSGLGNVEIRIRDVRTGAESLLAGSGKFPFLDPTMSLDGSRLVYSDAPAGEVSGYVADSASNVGRPICEGCRVRDIFNTLPAALIQVKGQVMRQPFDAGAPVPLMDVPSGAEVALSPDGRQLAFTAPRPQGGARLYLADISQPPVSSSSWKLVAEDRNFLGSPDWAPNGNALHYLSQRDGFPCVWAQSISAAGTLEGAPRITLHIHPGSNLFTAGSSIAVANDRIFVLKADTRGDVFSIALDK